MKLKKLFGLCVIVGCLFCGSNIVFAENLNANNDDFIQIAAVEDNWLNREIAKQCNKDIYNLTISDYQSITSIMLYDIDISNSIPLVLQNLSNLQYFHVVRGNLTGSIPESFTSLTKLKGVALYSNNLINYIPDDIGDLVYLEDFNLAHNKLSGSIPKSVGKLSSITYFALDGNNLTGTIPNEFFNLPQIRYLNLSQNNLSGSIPENLYNTTSLEDLNLARNNLTGEIPSSIANISNQLIHFDVNDNNFIGTIDMNVVEKIGLSSFENNLFNNIPNQKQLTFKE